jgi:menaquinone-dependent protoporphyrinogen IX oxidase
MTAICNDNQERNAFMMQKKRRALILYATMTKNTEKVATWFKETFETYQWDVTMYRLKNNMDLTEMQPNVYFDDYDVVCLGSPIVAGYPLKIVSKLFSLGAHSGLEEQTTENVNKGGAFSIPPMPQADTADGAAQEPIKQNASDLTWRRSGNRGPYPGAIYFDQYKPLGIVFTTYGGGFYGSDECTATLEILKLYLQLNNVSVIGRFACCGKEFGPAGLKPGEKPMFNHAQDGTPMPIPDAEIYEMTDGTQFAGSYFFHARITEKPGPRDEAKAKALIGDIVEDYFCSFNGQRNMVGSQYISIS